jgi:hypothetical protein
MSTTPDEPSSSPLTTASRVRPRTQVRALPFVDEGVIVDVPPRQAHIVNASALAVWQCLDGVTLLDDVIDELADRYAVDRSVIAPDIVGVMEHYRHLSLVELVTTAPATPGAGPAESSNPWPTTSPCIGRDLVEVDGHRYLVLPPSTCRASLDALPWQPVCALAIGDHRLGVRSNSPEADAMVRRAFARHVVDDDRVAANYSVVVMDDDAEAVAGRAHQRSGLYEGNQWLGTVPKPLEIIRALARRLAAAVADDPPMLRLEALTIVGDTGAVLLPWFQGVLGDRTAAIADRPGWSSYQAPIWIDTATRELRLDPPGIDLDLSDLDGPEPGAPPSAASAGTATSSPTLAGIVLAGGETARLEGAAAVAALVPMLNLAPADDVEAILGLLVELANRVPVITADFDDMADVAAALVRAR